MVKSFIKFVNEKFEAEERFIRDLSTKLIQKIRTSREPASESYLKYAGMEFTEPYAFDLILFLRRDSNVNFQRDEHFKNLPWEELNYSEYGYAIDANLHVSKPNLYHKIIIHLILDPNQEPHLYTKLFARLIDILTHETNHLEQIGSGREAFNEMPSNPDERELAKKSYKYFLLDDEVESMVEGMHASAAQQGKPLDQVFDEYLRPFIESSYITQEEYSQVMQKWVTFASQNYPEAKFSPKVDEIINNL